MFEIVLYSVIAFLILTNSILFFLLHKQKHPNKPTQTNSPLFEDLFNSFSIPLFYILKGVGQGGNKAFLHAFGKLPKEVFTQLSALPKNSENPLELTYDNGIKKNTLVYTSTLLDSEKNVSGLIGAITDITALQKSKDTLLVQKQRLELALEGSQDGIWDWDMKSDVVFFSSKWKSIMGYEAQDSPNTLSSWLNLVHTKDMAVVNQKLKEHLDGNSELFFVDHRIRNSNPLQWVTVRGKVIFGKNNKAQRMVGTIRDISVRKKHEEDSNRIKERFASFIEDLPAIAFIKDMHGKYLFINTFYQKYLGFKTWQDKTPSELFDASTAENIIETDRLSLYEDKIEHSITIPTEEGALQEFKLYKFPIENEDGERSLCGFGIMINKPFREA